MELLRTIFNAFKRRSANPLSPITFTSEGFSSMGSFVLWSEIEEISAFKLDLFTTDEVRFSFNLQSTGIFHISEEQPGFPDFIRVLAEHFPSIADWESKIIPPAFKENHTVLYRRT